MHTYSNSNSLKGSVKQNKDMVFRETTKKPDTQDKTSSTY